MKRWYIGLTALLLIIMLTACSSGANYNSESQQLAEMQDSSSNDLSGTADLTDGRKVIQDASLSMTVEAVGAARDALSQKAEQIGGFVQSSNSYGSNENNDFTDCHIVLQVPSNQLTPMLRWLEDQGRITESHVYTQDITSDYVDLQSRLRNAEAQEAALLSIYDMAKTVEDTLRVRDELYNVQKQIEEYKGRLALWDRITGMSTLDIRLTQTALVVVPDGKMRVMAPQELWQRMAHGFNQSWRFVVNAVYWLLIAISTLGLPAIAVLLCVLLIVRLTRNKKPTPQAYTPVRNAIPTQNAQPAAQRYTGQRPAQPSRGAYPQSGGKIAQPIQSTVTTATQTRPAVPVKANNTNSSAMNVKKAGNAQQPSIQNTPVQAMPANTGMTRNAAGQIVYPPVMPPVMPADPPPQTRSGRKAQTTIAPEPVKPEAGVSAGAAASNAIGAAAPSDKAESTTRRRRRGGRNHPRPAKDGETSASTVSAASTAPIVPATTAMPVASAAPVVSTTSAAPAAPVVPAAATAPAANTSATTWRATAPPRNAPSGKVTSVSFSVGSITDAAKPQSTTTTTPDANEAKPLLSSLPPPEVVQWKPETDTSTATVAESETPHDNTPVSQVLFVQDKEPETPDTSDTSSPAAIVEEWKPIPTAEQPIAEQETSSTVSFTMDTEDENIDVPDISEIMDIPPQFELSETKSAVQFVETDFSESSDTPAQPESIVEIWTPQTVSSPVSESAVTFVQSELPETETASLPQMLVETWQPSAPPAETVRVMTPVSFVADTPVTNDEPMSDAPVVATVNEAPATLHPAPMSRRRRGRNSHAVSSAANLIAPAAAPVAAPPTEKNDGQRTPSKGTSRGGRRHRSAASRAKKAAETQTAPNTTVAPVTAVTAAATAEPAAATGTATTRRRPRKPAQPKPQAESTTAVKLDAPVLPTTAEKPATPNRRRHKPSEAKSSAASNAQPNVQPAAKTPAMAKPAATPTAKATQSAKSTASTASETKLPRRRRSGGNGNGSNQGSNNNVGKATNNGNTES